MSLDTQTKLRGVLEKGRPWTLLEGDSSLVLPSLPEACIDAVVTDPPYELAFMNAKWDQSGIAFSAKFWAEVLRVLKPGGHLVAFGGTRTYHRITVAIEDAGFECRDSLVWIHGQGFPKSLDVGKAIDKHLGAKRTEVVGFKDSGLDRDVPNPKFAFPKSRDEVTGLIPVTLPATVQAAKWEGFGSAIKPAFEPITLARKPLDGSIAENVLKHGTGALNIAASRVGTAGGTAGGDFTNEKTGMFDGGWKKGKSAPIPAGRFPPNIVLSHAEGCVQGPPVDGAASWKCVKGCPVLELDRQGGVRKGGVRKGHIPLPHQPQGLSRGYVDQGGVMLDGGVSQFFPTFPFEAPFRYVPKPVEAEKRAGKTKLLDQNTHTTVKPTALMSWLVRLITPPGGVVLDPFAGSGTTLVTAVAGGFRVIGIEREAEYAEIIRRRLYRRLTEE